MITKVPRWRDIPSALEEFTPQRYATPNRTALQGWRLEAAKGPYDGPLGNQLRGASFRD